MQGDVKGSLAPPRRGERKRRGPKPKPISVVMSKYRRREANARERQRQGEINKGFEYLRDKIPSPVLNKGKCEKLRKIDVLHVAISYIRALENILESGEPGINDFANSLYSVVPQDFFAKNTDKDRQTYGRKEKKTDTESGCKNSERQSGGEEGQSSQCKANHTEETNRKRKLQTSADKNSSANQLRYVSWNVVADFNHVT